MRQRVRPLAKAVLTCCLLIAVAAASAQAPKPNYTDDMPSVERVKAEIKGSDATDSLARQVAVFNYLVAYIDRIKSQRDYRGPFTPGEQKLFDAYRLAAYQISQDYAKTHTPAEAQAFERRHGQYEMDSAFYKDWSGRLIGKQSAAAYKNAEAGLAATQKKHIEDVKRQNEEAQARKDVPPGQQGKLWNDPTAVATRRCLELGGTDLECLGKGFKEGLMDLIGLNNTPIGNAIKESAVKGLRMGGTYRAENGISIAFNENTAFIYQCGKLIPGARNYTLAKRGDQLAISISNEPRPLVVALGASGLIVGPGPVEITGQIITGYQTYDVWSTNSDGTIVPGSQHQESRPVYADKTERCTFTSLRPAGTTAADVSPVALISSLFGGQESQEMREDQKHPTPPGPRMAGTFTAGSLKLDFHPVAVILDCGQAHVARAYSVKNAPDGVLVSVMNDANPFTLMLRADGTLAGSGSADVTGRLLTGQTQNGFTYQPHRETCSIGTLTAR
jgi:hypothetical protein